MRLSFAAALLRCHRHRCRSARVWRLLVLVLVLVLGKVSRRRPRPCSEAVAPADEAQ